MSLTTKKINLTKDFQRDMKKLGVEIITSPEFTEVFQCFHKGIPLPQKYKDHDLKGKLKGYRDCHIFNDLVLIYKIENETLYLLRVGTHSAIFKR